jgi:hypothetical protein
VEGCFVSNADMKNLRTATEYVWQAIDRCEKKGRTALENDPAYKGFYPTVLELQEKCADILMCFIRAGAISLVHKDHLLGILGLDTRPEGITLHVWVSSEVKGVKTPQAENS